METTNTPFWPGWETVRLIGHGNYGVVYEIERTIGKTTEKSALKVITIPKERSEIRGCKFHYISTICTHF